MLWFWIFVENIDSKNLKNTKLCSQIIAMNKALFFHPQIKPLNTRGILPSGLEYSIYYNSYLQELRESSQEINVTLQSNPYVNVLYDSIWAIALSINGSFSVLSLIDIKKDKRS